MGLRTWLSDCISKKALLIAFVHWYVTFFIEKNFFVTSTLEKSFIAIAKLFVIVCFWQIAFYMVRRYKQDPEYRRYIHFAGAYFIFSMVLLLLIWPGNMCWDDLLILNDLRNFQLRVWQGLLSSLFYFFAISIYSNPISVLILNLFVISLVVGYFIYALYKKAGSKIIVMFGFIPFLIPNVLLQNFFPLRAGIFAYLILYFLTKIIFYWDQGKKITTKETLWFAVIASLICTIRGEGIYFLIVAPILFICSFKHASTKKQKFIFTFITLLITFAISWAQGAQLGKLEKTKYTLTMFIEPFGVLVNVAMNENRLDLLKKSSAVINITQLKDISGSTAFWQRPLLRKEYEIIGNKPIIKDYFRLIKQYPKPFLSERWKTMVKSGSPWICTKAVGALDQQSYYQCMFKNTIADYLDQPLRERVLRFINCETSKTAKLIFHNIKIPLLLLLLLTTILFLKKLWIPTLALFTIYPAIFLVFISAPRSFFMYHFLEYLTGYAFAFGSLIILLSKIINRFSRP